MSATAIPFAEPTRRDFLYIATGAAGAVGAVATIVPFMSLLCWRERNYFASWQFLPCTFMMLMCMKRAACRFLIVRRNQTTNGDLSLSR